MTEKRKAILALTGIREEIRFKCASIADMAYPTDDQIWKLSALLDDYEVVKEEYEKHKDDEE